jgi:hypothetical protein
LVNICRELNQRDTRHCSANAPNANAISKTSTDEKWTLAALLALKPYQLEDLDIGLTNLLCAEGLRGSENLDLDKSLNRLDEMAHRVRLETDRNMHRFGSNPAEYENSEPYYRMAMLVTVLQQDFGIIYNPDRVTPVGGASRTTNSSRIRVTFLSTASPEKRNREPAPPCLRSTLPLVAD